MADANRALDRVLGSLVSVLRHPLAACTAFLLVHLWLGNLNLHSSQSPMTDVTYVYKFWVEQFVVEGFRVGVDSQWVYPVVAFVPMLLAYAFGPEFYGATWLSMVLVLNLVALGFLTGWGRRRDRVNVAWWWIFFLVALGPIALGRIDSVSVPLAIIGMLLLASRPRAAAIVLAIATWMKVWPAALLAAVIIASRHRVRVLVAITATSLAIIATALLMGSGANVFSFITQQAGRGLQIEAPVSTVWLWLAASGSKDTFVYYDSDILTYQVDGDGTAAAAALMTPLLGFAVAVVSFLGIRAVRRGANVAQLLPPLALALVTAFIVFNKVGSPQFESWLAVPVIVGLMSALGGGRSFRVPASLALVIAAMTQVIYPTFYPLLLGLDPMMLALITARNLLLVALLIWAIVCVVRAGAPAAEPDLLHPDVEHADLAEPSTWPLASPLQP